MQLKAISCIKHNKQYYDAGEILEVTEDEAQELLDLNLAEPVSDDKPAEKPEPANETAGDSDDKTDPETEDSDDDLTQINGVGEELDQALKRIGIKKISAVADSAPEAIAVIPGIGVKTARNIIKAAKKALK